MRVGAKEERMIFEEKLAVELAGSARDASLMEDDEAAWEKFSQLEEEYFRLADTFIREKTLEGWARLDLSLSYEGGHSDRGYHDVKMIFLFNPSVDLSPWKDQHYWRERGIISLWFEQWSDWTVSSEEARGFFRWLGELPEDAYWQIGVLGEYSC